jgi:hypothetical protein
VDFVRPLLARLADAHLVVQHVPGRFMCHDLLTAYASSLLGPREATEALHRLFSWCLDMSMGAMERIDPNRRKLVLPSGVAFDSYDEAMTWLETERPTFARMAFVCLGAASCLVAVFLYSWSSA